MSYLCISNVLRVVHPQFTGLLHFTIPLPVRLLGWRSWGAVGRPGILHRVVPSLLHFPDEACTLKSDETVYGLPM